MNNKSPDSASPYAGQNVYDLDKTQYLKTLAELFTYKPIALKMFAQGVHVGDRVFDAGCGPGIDLPKLSGMVGPKGQVIGMDYDNELLKEADDLCTREGLKNVRLIQGDLQSIDIPDSYFNAVRCDRVLQHVEDPRKVVIELSRVLKPGGALVVSDPLWRTWSIEPNSEIAQKVISYKQNKNIRNPNFPDEVAQLLRSLKFKNIESKDTNEVTNNFEIFDDFFYIHKLLQVMMKNDQLSESQAQKWLHDIENVSLEHRGEFKSQYTIRTFKGFKHA
ncbi:methyltransferase domain-containing protein [Candidatus Roizmanbacteria bacterium]|nr:methyltransferase domain-containing protein [Candidatus Roizmanbacteria bacterium]